MLSNKDGLINKKNIKTFFYETLLAGGTNSLKNSLHLP